MPPFARGLISKAEYHLRRNEYFDRLRGLPHDLPYNPRVLALEQMEDQLARQTAADPEATRINASSWTPIGPAPIPNGQTTAVSTAVSGRVTSIAVHPTNPNIVYVGTAQAGVYRTLNGGTTWTPIFDAAQSLAIGAVAIAPSDPSIVYVGTGEAGGSNDSFFGVGLYRINNAETTADLTGPINPVVTSGTTVTVTANAFAGRAISRILVHPTIAATIFVATSAGLAGSPPSGPSGNLHQRGVFRSTNATAALASIAFQKLAVTSANSADVPPTGDRNVTDMVFEPGNPNILVAWVQGLPAFPAFGDGGAYRSTNALAATPSFVQIYATEPNLAGTMVRGELAINRVGSTVTLFAATGEATDSAACTNAKQEGRVIFSNDGVGAAFAFFNFQSRGFCGAQCFYDIAIAVDPANANVLHLGGAANGICSTVQKRSTNFLTAGVLSANNAGLHADTHAIVVAPSNSSIVYAGNDGGIFKSTDAGASWTSLNNAGFNATQFQSLALHPTDSQFMIGGTQDNGTQCLGVCGSNSNPNAWTRADFGDGGYARIDRNAVNTTAVTMYHTYFNIRNDLIGFSRVGQSSCAADGQWLLRGTVEDPTPGCGGAPTAALNGINASDNVLFYAPLELGPGNPNTVYFGTDRLYRSINQGDAMTVVSQAPIVAGTPIASIAISPQNDNVRIVGLVNGSVWRTTTGSSTLINVTPPGAPARTVGRVTIDPNDANIAYVSYGGYGVTPNQHVWKTVNLNAAPPTWTAAGAGIPDVPVNAFAVDPANSQHLFAGTDIGVYRSTDSGAGWSAFSAGLPRVAVFDLAIQNPSRVLRIATHGRGIWEISLVSNVAPVALAGTLTVNEDTAGSGTLAATDADGNPLTFSIVTNGTSGTATITNPATGAYTYTPSANANGPDSFAFRANDGIVNSNVATVSVTLNAVNDAPTITDIGNQAIDAGTATPALAFTIGDVETPAASLTVSGASSNLKLVPVANIVFGGSGASRTVTVSPAAQQTGTATITVTVSDGGLGASDIFVFTVRKVPTVTITSPATPSATSTSPFFTLAGTAAVAADSAAAADGPLVAVTWTSSRGPTGTATGTTNWSAEVPLMAGANVMTVTATDASGATGTAAVTINVSAFVYYFAEGATGTFFDLELGIANPNAVDAPVQIQYLKEDGSTVNQALTVGAQRRATITVDDLAGLQNTAVSAVVTSTNALPLAVERTMRWDARGYGSHTEKATSGARLEWFFAEGSQGFFDTFILLANPQTTTNSAIVSFLRESGGPVTKTYSLPPTSRLNVHTGAIPELVSASFGVTVTFAQPGVAERAMYFGTPLFNGGHESAGVTEAATSWFLAEGAVGDFFDTYVLVSNPNADATTVTFTFLRDVGEPTVRTQVLAGNARLTMSVDAVFPTVTNGAVATQVTADRPIVVERAMYWPGGFTSWYEAHNAFGVTGTATRWALGEGRRGGPSQFETYILLANPGATAASVTITYLREGANPPVVRTYIVPAASRFNVVANSIPEIGDGERFGALIESTAPIAVERALYSNASGVFWAAGTNATATRVP